MAMRNTSKYNVSVTVYFDKLCSKFETSVTVRLERSEYNMYLSAEINKINLMLKHILIHRFSQNTTEDKLAITISYHTASSVKMRNSHLLRRHVPQLTKSPPQS